MLHARVPRRRTATAAALLAILLAGAPQAAGGDTGGSLTDFHHRWTWSIPGQGIGQRGFTVLDLDGDGRDEIVATAWGDYWWIARSGAVFRQLWSSLRLEGQLLALTAAETAVGSRVVAATPDVFQVWDGARREVLVEFANLTTELSTLHIADLDGDDQPELLACDSDALYVFDLATGATEAVRFGFGCTSIDTGQVDADPQLEIAIAGNPAGGYLLDGSTFAVDWGDVRGFGSLVVLSDLDGDTTDEIVSTIEVWGGLRAQDPGGGGTIWEEPDIGVRALVEHDVDPDSAGPEVLWGEGPWGSVHVLAGLSGTELWSLADPDTGVNGLAVGDTDGDGQLEVAWSSGSTGSRVYVASTLSHEVECMSESLQGVLPSLVIGDLAGDGGQPELAAAIASRDNYYRPGGLVVVSFHDGRVLRSTGADWPGTFDRELGQLAGAQLDGDPPIELCVATVESGGHLGCYDGLDFTEQWLLSLPLSATALGVAELDGGGVPEFVAGTNGSGFLYAFEGDTGWLKWRSPPLSPAPGRFDRLLMVEQSDGAPEVVAAFAGYAGPAGFVGASGELRHGPYDLGPLAMLAAELDGDPGQELLIGLQSGTVVLYDLETGTPGPVIADFPEPVYGLARADVTRDGVEDLIAVGSRLRVFDGDSATLVWTSPFLAGGGSDDIGLIVGDFDGNSVPDLAVTNGVGIAVFGSPLFAIFADGVESGDTSAWSVVVP